MANLFRCNRHSGTFLGGAGTGKRRCYVKIFTSFVKNITSFVKFFT